MQLTVSRLYRPGDTHLGREAAFRNDWNLVYWTNETRLVPLAKVVDKCVLVCSTAIDQPIEEFVNEGPYRFYFNKAYNPSSKEFEPLPSEAERIGSSFASKGKGKGGKATSKSFNKPTQTTLVSYQFNQLMFERQFYSFLCYFYLYFIGTSCLAVCGTT